MKLKRQTLWLFAVGFAAVPAAWAATPPALDPAAPTPSESYRSVFDGYKPFKEAAITDWRALNEEVGRVGGHVGIMRGAGGHAGHGGGAAKPPAVTTEGGQPPVRSAPKAPAGDGHTGH